MMMMAMMLMNDDDDNDVDDVDEMRVSLVEETGAPRKKTDMIYTMQYMRIYISQTLVHPW